MEKANRPVDISFKQGVAPGISGAQLRYFSARERKSTEVVPKKYRS
ncbi:MAG TPA: hypothetical protein H9796_11690 [Candidatus Butyricimonas faecavium]|nr:hypothetical protein [Candidatus Butyricimonas faecavium]